MAAHALYLLHCGLLHGPGAGGPAQAQVPAYLIESAAGKRYLIDTGNPAALIGAPEGQPWYPAQCTINPEDDVLARLAELGLAPRDVDAIIATHFDFDHAGRLDAFGPLGTDVWVQRAHLAWALTRPDPSYGALWNVPGLRWRLVDGDFEIEPGLRVLRTDGHAKGHQSILVETGSGWVILAVDAIDDAELIESREFPNYTNDIDQANVSLDRLVALSSEYGAPIIFGHDYGQWQTLPHSPEPYRRT
jgi:N-acyl homoserine lactone hydrolase